MTEKILCAAVWINDGKFHQGQPRNIDFGYVVGGLRHGWIFTTLAAIHGNRNYLKFKPVQGFLTTENRFVDRKRAVKIALEAGQIEQEKLELYSEDLY